MNCQWAGTNTIACSVNTSEDFDLSVRSILESGFTNTLVYRVYLFRNDSRQAVAAAVVSFAEVFRLYTETYFIGREGIEGYITCENWTSAIESLSVFSVELSIEPDEASVGYTAMAILEVNPLSTSNLAEARNWIAQSGGMVRFFGVEEQSFFGNFMTLLFNRGSYRSDVVRYYRSNPIEVLR